MTGAPPALLAAPAEPIRRGARDYPTRTALRDRTTGRVWTYAELDAAAEAWAAWLDAQGVAPGDRVAVLAGNAVAHVLLLVACLRRRAALVPLNWRLAAPELVAVLGDANPRVLLAEARFAEGLGAVSWHDLGRVTPAPAPAHAPAHAPANAPVNAPVAAPTAARSSDGTGDPVHRAPIVLDPDAIGLVLYTSGSTGRPKGAMLPVRQLATNAIATVEAWALVPEDIGPVSTPFFHTGGWNVFAVPLWWIGGTVVLAEAFDASTWLPMLADEGCTVAFAVPTQLALVAEADGFGLPLPALRWIIAGGAPCPTALQARFRAAGYAVREGFGMTEFGPNCFTVRDGRPDPPPGWVGWPVPFADLRLVDEQGRDVPDGTPGELWLRGPQRFTGYLFDPIRTAEALTPDGWYRSGDVLVRDGDGAYRVFGRRKEMFISGGENVYPGEVEAALVEHPAVAEAVVVAMPDATWGEVGCAFVVPRAGATVDSARLVAHARARLAGYKVPKRIDVLADLPRLGSGKADRRALAARATAPT